MRYFIFTFLCLFFFCQSVASQNTEKTTYQVQQSEGLFAIARKLGVSVDDLCKWNNLTKESVIHPGQTLTVFVKQNAHTHTVQQGETLYFISKKWNVSVNDLQKWNELKDNNIQAGQKLTVYTSNNIPTEEPKENKKPEPEIIPKKEETGMDNDDVPAVKPLINFATQQRILFFGDSMIEGINKRMRQYAAENDHDVLNVIWYSASTKWWAQHSDTISYFIRTFKPTYIIICLGANELFIKDVQGRDAYVKQILAKLGNLPYVWVGPPNWKEDTGINNLIQKNVGEERFFPSKNYKFSRTSDGAHLTRSAANDWMDLIAQWLNSDVPEPLLMNVPSDETKMRGKNTLLMPLK